ncbi:hypothetical protein TIFTF001_024319 [Ficus carica]|uniref:RBR-type E3 ubiquitin transferase n=1 Tax=Ficus carica TaxID=3494 RepID=A0AA88AGF7_FICCA|nr:hypothetical protein TIFTF001_024319 [Ficus carica]
MVDRSSSGDKMEENDGSASDGEHGFEEYEDDDFNATHDSNFGFNPDPVITKESLLAEQWGPFAEGKNELYAEAGVPLFKHGDGLEFSSSSRVTCAVCAVEVPANERRTMECGHYFCNTFCDESKVRKLLGDKDPNLAEKFDYFLLKSYMEDSTKVKWCPSVPHCGNAIRIDGDVLCEVECDCGLEFRFSCLSEAHSPCSCLFWELWNKSWLCGRRAGRDHKNGCPVKEKQVTRSSKKNERYYSHFHQHYTSQQDILELGRSMLKNLPERRLLFGESDLESEEF